MKVDRALVGSPRAVTEPSLKRHRGCAVAR